METYSKLYDAVLGGSLELAVQSTNAAIDAGIDPQSLINEYMIKAMEEIGARFEVGQAFVPNLLMSARAMKGALDIIRPLIADRKTASLGTIIIGTVKDDLHDIGKNLVASMLEGCGFDVINIGVNVPTEKFVDAVRHNNADILCMSALLTTTMMNMKDVIQAFEKEGIRDQVKIMVGGAPLSESFAREIGADGFSENANSAVGMAKLLMKNKNI